jgi:hypothetical protein
VLAQRGPRDRGIWTRGRYEEDGPVEVGSPDTGRSAARVNSALNKINGKTAQAQVNISLTGKGVSYASKFNGVDTSRRGPHAAGPTCVHTTIVIGGHAIVSAITPEAQRRKLRSGVTGLA